ncbi:polysaccharide deacetylase family protein [Candidatus Pelagibacter sp.]|nr:polysaccharide deacetylase family protein [Candidatus Pelagibacter sp.]
MFHDVEDLSKFEKQIYLLKKNWKFIKPEDLIKISTGKKKIKGRLLLLTFDDAFKSNLYVAEKILKKYKIKAIFFIPFQFVLLKNKIDKKKFIKNNLKLGDFNNFKTSMNIYDLKKILRLNHYIGAHTFSHKNLKNITNEKVLNYEIVQSANNFQKILNTKIKCFAFNFGRINHISAKMIKIASKKYKILFTGVRGGNLENSNLIFRDNISSNDNISDINVYLSGFYDSLYQRERNKLKFLNKLNS